ncbi:DUF2884 family protein [Dokdonella soli]|uniref:DUF2884 family protein n=1 Tax=Dokdonella soli TaxID=529810 RepID=A0ABN1IKN6_9GAMM
MRPITLVVAACALIVVPGARAQDLATTCHASSSYDLTIAPDALRFDRTTPAPKRIDLRNGQLGVEGTAVRLNAEDSDRLALFEHDLRALVPKVKAVAAEGVDLAVKSVRAETANLGLSAQTRGELDQRLAARSAELKRRIVASTSTHDWQGDAFDGYADDIAADIVPLLAADLGQQAVSAAVSGDLDAAATLRDRAADLAGDLRPRLERRMQALGPRIQALCPSVRHLYELQRDMRANGRPLDLLQVGKD